MIVFGCECVCKEKYTEMGAQREEISTLRQRERKRETEIVRDIEMCVRRD